MTEINVESKQQRGILLWILGLILLLLVIWALTKAMDRRQTVPEDRGSAVVDRLRDNTPPHLRQYAARLEETDRQVVLETLRAAGLADLPVYEPA